MESAHPSIRKSLAAYREAQLALEAQRPQEALVHLRHSLAADPEFLDARFEKAKVLRLLGEHGEALEQLERCLQEAPEDEAILEAAAETALLEGEIQLAAQYNESLQQIDPENEDWCGRSVGLAFAEGGPRSALKAVEGFLKRRPDWTTGRLLAGHAHFLLGKTALCIEAYQEVLDKNPDHRGALENLRRVKKEEPPQYGLLDQGLLELVLAEAVRLSSSGRSARAFELLEKWRPRFSERPAFLEVLAKIAFEVGDRKVAQQALAGLGVESLSNHLTRLQARILIAEGETAQALEVLENLAAQDPHSPETWIELARAKEGQGDFEGSLAAAAQARELAPHDLEAAFLEARGLKKTGRGEECQAVLERILEARPDHQAALFALGVERLLSNRNEAALGLLLEVVRISPHRVEGWRHVAIALTRLERWEESRQAWREVLRLAPGDDQAVGNLEKIERRFPDSREANAATTSPRWPER